MEMGVGGLWHYSNKLFPCLVHYCKSSATSRLSYNATELQDHLKQMKAKYEAVHVGIIYLILFDVFMVQLHCS